MKKSQYIAKLNHIAKLSHELQEAAEKDFGKEAMVFVSDDGGIHIMSGDSQQNRTDLIVYSSSQGHAFAVGAW